jgi:hypothetical protein
MLSFNEFLNEAKNKTQSKDDGRQKINKDTILIYKDNDYNFSYSGNKSEILKQLTDKNLIPHFEKLYKLLSKADSDKVFIPYEGNMKLFLHIKPQQTNEAKSDYKVYMIDKEFWLAYGEGSGTTAQVSNINSFLTNKSGDTHYDSIVDGVTKKFVKFNAPQMKKVSSDKMTHYSLYTLPTYKHSDVKQGKILEWGGTIKPFTTYYMLVIEGETNNIIQFFKTAGEAKSYINSLS